MAGFLIRTANCIGIYYGEGKGLDACNIFARVIEEDAALLQKLGRPKSTKPLLKGASRV